MYLNILSMETIDFDKSITTKEQLFDRASILFKKVGIVSNANEYKNDLFKREEQMSTAIEDGFAIPHAKSSSVVRPGLAFIKTSPIIDYITLDSSAVEYSFIIAAPDNKFDGYLSILSHLARNLMDNKFRAKLKNSSTHEDVMKMVSL